jgi:methionine aminotransferase
MSTASSSPRTPAIGTKFPAMGTTIFTVMSALAAETNAVNLGQGFPDFHCDPKLLADVSAAMAAGHNQYPPMPGVLPLRQAMVAKIEALYGHRYDANSEITVTAGATQAIITAVLAIVRPGDEVIVLEPCYDSYVPNIELAGGVVVRVPLAPAPSARTSRRSPRRSRRARARSCQHAAQPERHRLDAAEMRSCRTCWRPPTCFVISDEVYEHMVFDGAAHQSAARFPAWRRALHRLQLRQDLPRDRLEGRLRGGAGALTAEFRKVHQFNVFTVNTPMQHGLASYMADPSPTCSCPPSTSASATCSRGPGADAPEAAAQRRQLFPVRGHLAGERLAGSRLLQVAHHRNRGRRDPAVGVLRQRLRPARGAILLRQAGRHAANGIGPAGEIVRRRAGPIREPAAYQHCTELRQNLSSSRTTALARHRIARVRANLQAEFEFVLAEELVEQLGAERAVGRERVRSRIVSSSTADSGCGAGPDSTCAPRAGSYWLWSAQQWISASCTPRCARLLRKLMKLTSRVG